MKVYTIILVGLLIVPLSLFSIEGILSPACSNQKIVQRIKLNTTDTVQGSAYARLKGKECTLYLFDAAHKDCNTVYGILDAEDSLITDAVVIRNVIITSTRPVTEAEGIKNIIGSFVDQNNVRQWVLFDKKKDSSDIKKAICSLYNDEGLGMAGYDVQTNCDAFLRKK